MIEGQDVNRYAMSKGLILGALFALNYLLSTFSVTSFLSFGMEILIVVAAYRMTVSCRENVLDGVISYGRAWWYVVNLFLYSSMVSGVFKYVYLKWIRTDYLQSLEVQVREVFEQTALKGAEMNEVMSNLNEVLTPENVAIYSVFGDVMIGVFLGLIIAAIVKRDETYRHRETEE